MPGIFSSLTAECGTPPIQVMLKVCDLERSHAQHRALQLLAEQGPSYCVSVIHAAIVGLRGVGHVLALLSAPPAVKLVNAGE